LRYIFIIMVKIKEYISFSNEITQTKKSNEEHILPKAFHFRSIGLMCYNATYILISK
jgi:hypothetical protein